MIRISSRKSVAYLLLGFLIALACFLRLYLIADQILLDDEWHGMHFVLGKSALHLLTHFSIPGATCIPLNLYRLFLLKTIGWNEILLRIPSLLAGIACVLIFPLMVPRAFTKRTKLVFAALLAISPFLVFYSRVCRPYSAVAFFGFVSFAAFCSWLKSGGAKYAFLFIVTGVLATYFHLFAAVGLVGLPLAGILNRAVLRSSRKNGAPTGGPSFLSIIAVGAIAGLLSTLLLAPALLDSLETTFFEVAGTGTLQEASAWSLVTMFAGTQNPVLVVALLSQLLVGIVVLYRTERAVAISAVILSMMYIVALLMSSPYSIHVALVISRYCIVLYPIGLLLVAVGIDACAERLKRAMTADAGLNPLGLTNGLIAAYLLSLLMAGPLPWTYCKPNSFTNHSAFQQSYRRINWETSFFSEMTPSDYPLDTVLARQDMPPFLHELGSDQRVFAVIHYPMMIGDHFNPLYFYQHYHGKRVIVGYDPEFGEGPGLAKGNIYGNTYVDQILQRVDDKAGGLRFRNMVNIRDPDAVQVTGAKYLIIHKDFPGDLSRVAGARPHIEDLTRVYKAFAGEPIYEDRYLVVYGIPHKRRRRAPTLLLSGLTKLFHVK